jgi:predicted HTH transcriptional regulator
MKCENQDNNKGVVKTVLVFVVSLITGFFLVDLMSKRGSETTRSCGDTDEKDVDKHSKKNETVVENLSERKQNIVEYLCQKESVSVPELSNKFPDVSDRTLRRDMNSLEDIGLVNRKGSTKATVYYISEGVEV